MRNLLRFNVAAEVLGIGVDGLYVQAAKRPHWYVKKNGTSYVDIAAYNRQRVLTGRCYEYNTSILYWMMRELFATRKALAEWLAKMSTDYKVVTSWNSFFDVMFASEQSHGVALKRTMQSEFFKVSYITIKLAIEKGFEFDERYHQGYTETST